MKKIQKTQKIRIICLGIFMIFLFLGAVLQGVTLGQEYYVISVNGRAVGSLLAHTDVQKLIRNARRNVMQNTQGYAHTDADITVATSREKFQRLMTEETLLQKLELEIEKTKRDEKQQAYTITSGNYSANFTSKEQALQFLEQVKNCTEDGRNFQVVLNVSAGAKDAKKAEIINPTEEPLEEVESTSCSSGISNVLLEMCIQALQEKDKVYENQTGILSMGFADTVYGYENYAAQESFADISKEVKEVTKEKETNTIYVVEAGDCLSIIAEKFDTTMDSIVALNQLKSKDATVYLDQELIVAVPKPDISILISMGEVYEENYEAAPSIVPNDAWYSTKEVVLKEGTEGYWRVNDLVTYENGLEVARETLHTTVLEESIPAVVEQGTKIPPTYIKPISGGRFTSGYGKRWGRTHKGVDWAISVGNTVYASSAGTVSVAGAVRGYGYAVYINHPDGRQTRYGHLSKVLVSPGQWVEQGQTIALSGNTGRSTGPHLHFEILIDGSQVNPLNYMN